MRDGCRMMRHLDAAGELGRGIESHREESVGKRQLNPAKNVRRERR